MRDPRTFVLATAAFALFAVGIVAQVFAATVTLRAETSVEGEAIHLADLFDGVASGGETVVAAAPRPGQSLVLDAVALKRLAERQGLDWQPRDADMSATVTRATREIDGAEIESLVTEALAERLLSSEFEIELSGAWPTLVAPAELTEGPLVLDLKLDARSGRFTTQIGALRGVPAAEQAKIAGRVIHTEKLPVPIRSIAANEVISEADIEWRKFRNDHLGQDPVLSADAIIGKAPRRALRQGVPVRASELAVPLIVQKGAPVTMVYVGPGIQLTMIGRALEGGSQGQWIRVLNPQSKLMAYGAVLVDGTVQVSPGAPINASAGQVALESNDGEIW